MLRWTLGLAVTAVVLLVALAFWVSGTTSGLRAVARVAQSATAGAVRLEGVDGRLIDRLTIDRLAVDLPDFRLAVERLEFHWAPLALLEEQLELRTVAAESVQFAARPGEPAPAGPPAPPQGIPVPLRLDLGRLAVGRLLVSQWAESGFGDTTLRIDAIEVGAQADRARIAIAQAAARLPWGEANARGTVATASPFELAIDASLAGEYQDRPYRLALSALGTLLEPRLTLTGSSAGVDARIEAVARPFEAVPLAHARLSAGPLDPAEFAPDAPRAALYLDADLRLPAAPAGSTPDPLDWAIAGPVSIVNREAGAWDGRRIPLERLDGTFRWQGRRLVTEDLRLALTGEGRISGRAAWQPAAQDPVGRFDVGLRLDGVRPRALDARLPETVLAGTVDGSGDGEGQQARLAIAGEGLSLDALAKHGGRRVTLSELRLTRGEATVSGEASLALDGERSFSARLGAVALDPSALFAEAPQAQLSLALEADGRLEPEPDVQLVYRFEPSQLTGHALAGEGRARLGLARISEAELWLSLAGNRVDARGAWGQEGDLLAIKADAGELDVIDPQLQGRALLDAELGGTPEQPAGRALLTADRLRLPGGWRLSGLNLQGTLAGGLDGNLVLAAGVGEVRDADRKTVLEHAGLSIEGSRAAHRAELNVSAPGEDALSATLQGGLDEDGGWRGRLLELQSRGRLAMRLDQPAELIVAGDVVSLGAARLSTGHGGYLSLDRSVWQGGNLDLAGRMGGFGIDLSAGPQDSDAPLRGRLQFGGEWDVRIAETVDGSFKLQREAGDLVLVGDAPAELGLSDIQLIANANAGDLAIAAHAEGVRLGKLAASLNTAVERDGAAVRLVPGASLLGSAQLDMPSVRWLGPVLSAQLLTGGRLKAGLSIAGTVDAPLAVGELEGGELELNLPEAGLRLAGGRLEASFDQDYLRIIHLEFVSPNLVRPTESRIPVDSLMAKPGRFLASGSIDLADGAGSFGFRADRLPLLQRKDRWLAVSGEGNIVSGWDSIDMKAVLEADAGAITVDETPPPSLSDDVVILGDEREPGNFRISADIGIRLGKSFFLTAMGLDTRLAGGIDIYVRPARPPAASGVILLEGGVFEGYGQKLAVENSSVNFAGPVGNPSLNITALRKGLEVEAGVAITGTARRPRVQLVSSPNVPDAEKLAWIVLGRPPDTTSGADLGLLIPAAQALLGGPGGGITSQLSNSLGLDQISIGQGDLNSAGRSATSSVVDSGVRSNAAGVSGQVVTLGKRLSSDTFLAFEQSLAGAESIVKLTHQLGERLSVVARGGTNNAVDLFYTFTFR
ncbi:MAG: translocation/assembly module TamB domain-containing protein [Rhodocyclaceae bacterium]|nr:translocation/assembly module TamB domain-containing protein [Rhodocyclaceae bacterium]